MIADPSPLEVHLLEKNDGHFVRLCVHLEDPSDLIEDLELSFASLNISSGRSQSHLYAQPLTWLCFLTRPNA